MVLATAMVIPADVCGTAVSTNLNNDENAVPLTTHTSITLLENYPTYTLTENENLPACYSVSMDYQGVNAVAVEQTYSHAFSWRIRECMVWVL